MSAGPEKRNPLVAERRATGKEARKRVPRAELAEMAPDKARPDPLALLRAQDEAREQDLVPIRYGRMSVSPFTFYRGSAVVMASDLAPVPRSGLTVQLCGDAHLANFGAYASPERTLLFDLNDFDETLPGPFEWDVKRLVASFVVAGRGNGFAADVSRDAALTATRSYREHMREFAEMRDLEVWYSRVTADDILALVRATAGAGKGTGKAAGKASVAAKTAARAAVSPKAAGTRDEMAAHTERVIAKTRSRDNLQAFAKLTEVVGGARRIREDPPLLVRVDASKGEMPAIVRKAFADYKSTLVDDRRVLVERFQFVDMARKVVGVGSVGTLCLIALLTGRDDGDPLLLQLKQAGPSVLEAHLGRSVFRNGGHRVVAGQRLMQAHSDIFLGWIRGSGAAHRDFYWRQLRDMKGSVDIPTIRPRGLVAYAELCGWCMARAHARSGDRITIASYLGAGDRFDRAMADFAEAYADRAETDHARLAAAIDKGRIKAETGL
jgi:uncharacterized protein (DUF2252 family)